MSGQAAAASRRVDEQQQKRDVLENHRKNDRAGKPALEATNLSKSYGGVDALRGVSLMARAGEILAIVGDNGAGKSTLISILSGIRRQDSGQVLIDGRPVDISGPIHAQQLGIATVFQNLALVNQRDVAANLHLGQEPRRFRLFVDRGRMRREALAALARLQVNLPSVRTLAGDLSGGQRQALAVARAVMRGRKIILMDEPTAALGVRESGQVLNLISRLRDEGMAVLLVSHNLDSVFNIADRIAVFRLGAKVADLRVRDTSHDEVVGFIVGDKYGGRAL